MAKTMLLSSLILCKAGEWKETTRMFKGDGRFSQPVCTYICQFLISDCHVHFFYSRQMSGPSHQNRLGCQRLPSWQEHICLAMCQVKVVSTECMTQESIINQSFSCVFQYSLILIFVYVAHN